MGKAEALRPALKQALDGVLAVLLAPRCAACDTVLEAPTGGPVCAVCWSRVRPVAAPCCRACGDPLPSWRVLSVAEGTCPRCRRAPPAFDGGRSAGEYEGALREILHAFKYEGRRSLAYTLGRLMRTAGTDLLADADAVVPVPLHPWRRLRRGFNQADDLARTLDLPVTPVLRRLRATPPQTGLTASRRRRNVRQAFGLSWHARLQPTTVRNRCLVLVDDVRTTGATLDACARVLKEAGAREVRILTAARAPLPRR